MLSKLAAHDSRFWPFVLCIFGPTPVTDCMLGHRDLKQHRHHDAIKGCIILGGDTRLEIKGCVAADARRLALQFPDMFKEFVEVLEGFVLDPKYVLRELAKTNKTTDERRSDYASGSLLGNRTLREIKAFQRYEVCFRASSCPGLSFAECMDVDLDTARQEL